ncbi:penicillin-binding transpeptidase domain-containing protein [Bacillus alkalicellulosilyticus]|uniref:penicillin-binding transpeptidase domain-containing protein n=1 Tax=Alkalihalobacterium alkalicellulosilyticum TaxID=1912214 RepID=UPI000995F8D5|nr:penicillin-binding transpeptidase domain-containing protein [Bacillus alkalicellulosilyticus]
MNMKKKMYVIGLLILTMVVGCSEKDPPLEETLYSFLEQWESGNYESMYSLLTTESKAAISKDDFTERYTHVYDVIGLNSITLSFSENVVEEEEIEEQALYPLTITMETMAGQVQQQTTLELIKEVVEEEVRWGVTWGHSLVLSELDKQDHVKVRTTPARRGEIYDRNGQGLAINGTALEIGFVPERMEGREEDSLQEVSEELEKSVEELETLLNQSWVRPDTFVPITAIPNYERDFAVRLYETIPGVTYREMAAREYPLHEAAAHLIGYIGLVTAEELEQYSDQDYHANSWIGKTGLERILEERLKGENGVVLYIEDDQGEEKQVIAEKEVVHGEQIALTIDAETQKTIHSEMSKDRDAGTAVVLNPSTGEVLSLLSTPAYNPNQFVLGVSSNTWQQWNEDEQKPLQNRFTQKTAPGSTIKPVTAAVALQQGWDSSEKRDIKGNQWQLDSSWGDYHVRRVTDPNHAVHLEDALVYSDNIYFAQMALELGQDKLIDGFEQFGFNEDIPFSYYMAPSSIANEDISSTVQLADTAYGQAELLVTPLHLALMYTPFVNEGSIPKPLLFVEEQPEVWKENVINGEHASEILSALTKAIESPSGTAHHAHMEDISLAGKTGTTEHKTSQSEKGHETGWFVAMETEKKNVLIVMSIEHVEDRGGSKYVVPKVKNILGKLQ